MNTSTPKIRSRNKFPFDLKAVASVPVLMTAGVLICGAAQAQQNIVVPRVPVAGGSKTAAVNTNLPNGIPNSRGNNLAPGSSAANPIYTPSLISCTGCTYTISGNTATVNEGSNTSGILGWNSFNIGAGSTVNFVQPSSTAVLLNRVDGAVSPSLINGVLNANGIVYLYNPNGMVFGRNSVVNVNSLVATSLDLDNSRFLSGILNYSTAPNFYADPNFAGVPGPVLVDGSITSATNGKIMLFAPNVVNNGAVTAPDGQVIMAAGGMVYLSESQSDSLRGLYVEVDSSNLPSGTATSVTNNGLVSVGRGNASLVGLAVNQNGMITAQTSVSLNGSIYLTAEGNSTAPTGTGTGQGAMPTAGGTLTLAAGSVTQVNIVDDGNTVTQGPGDLKFAPSQITLSGKNVLVQGSTTVNGQALSGASINAVGGNVAITATSNPSLAAVAPDSSSITLGSGSTINVSGYTQQQMPMSSNVISVQLLAELADNLVLRDSSLRGQTLNFDIRQGTNIADISADLAKIPYSVGQLAASGGTVSMTSDGSIVQNAGSTINVSGGFITYLPGYVNTSFLSSGGALYSVNSASADKTYSGVVNLPNGRWDYEPGYVEGENAGTVSFNAPSIAMQGTLLGNATNGYYQRSVNASNRAQGGQLIVNTVMNPGGADGNSINASALTYNDQLVLDNNASAAAVAGTTLPANRIDINVDTLKANGFTRLNFSNSGEIDVAGPISLASGGSLILNAFDDINNQYGNIVFYGGVAVAGGTLTATAANNLTVGTGVQFEMAGLWTNDSAAGHPLRNANGDPIGAIVNQGGDISLIANRLILDDDVTMDVSGGAWLNSKRKLSDGNGGNISLDAKQVTAYETQSNVIPLIEIGSDLSLQSYSLAQGGTLSMTTNNIYVGGFYQPTPDVHSALAFIHASSAAASEDPSQQYLWLPTGFFQQGGFTSFDLNAYNQFYVVPGSQITAMAYNWMFKSYDSYRTVASGSMNNVVTPGLLNLVGPQGGRSPVNLNFTAENVLNSSAVGTLTIGDNASIATDPTASVSLTAGQLLNIDGTISAPGGTIALGLWEPSSQGFYNNQRSIWLGSDAHLFAQGSTSLLYTAANGITSGSVLGGGQVDIGNASSDQGYLVVDQQSAAAAQVGATIDVSGTVSAPVVQASSRSRGSPQPVASAGGSIDILMREGILFDGTMQGKAGNSTQQGGTLSMTLEQESNLQLENFPDTVPNIFNIVAGAGGGNIPAGLTPGGNIGGTTNSLADQVWIGTGSFQNGGFDRLNFKSANAIVLSSASGSFNLNAAASLYLDAPTIQVATSGGASTPLTDAQISSAYVQLGSDDYRFQNTPTANSATSTVATANAAYGNAVSTGGPATLTVKATTIDLAGTTVLQGVGTTNLDAVQDIRLVGISQLEPGGVTYKPALGQLLPTGEFSVTGTLNLSASQVYPITLSSFALNAEGSNSALNFMYSGYKGQAPLSAAGALYGYAQNVNQDGVVEAPFGTIDFQAGKSLVYASGSTTSVAGNGVVPFGLVQNGRAWVYDFGGGNDVEISVDPSNSGNYPEMALPSKTIISQAPNINTEAGATLNLSGGGSLYSYEFTPGSYGTVDVLSNTTASGAPTTVYAINPNYTAAVAPRDYQYGYDSNLQPGQSVYLSGIAGLTAGYYVLLPAHYALLPGGMSITLAPNSANMPSIDNVVNLDGSVTVAGKANVLGLGTSINSGYVVTPGSIVRAESQYSEYSATSYFTAAANSAGVAIPQLPNDGGYLEFDASNTLALAGQFLLNPDTGGRRGTADISAPDIYVVGDSSQATPANALVLTASELNALNADSLMLGGLRQPGSGATNVTVGAQNITVENSNSTALNGSEFILVAQDNINIASGAVINAGGTLSQVPSNLNILATDPNGNNVGTGGALLMLSAGAPVTVTRQAPGSTQGSLNIQQGATLSATGSAYLDGTLTAKNDGQLNLSSGATLSVSSSSISLGNGAAPNAGGMQLSTAALAAFGNLAALNLNSYSTIDLYGAVDLGSAAMQNLTLDAAGMRGFGGGQTSVLTAQNVNFGGASTPVAALTSSGTLDVNAQNINLAPAGGNFAVNGFTYTNLNASNTINAVGSGSFGAQNNLTLTAATINATTLSNVTVQAGAALTLTQSGAAATNPATPQLGGTLNFIGNTIASNANINAQSGQIAMTAQNGVHVAGGTVNVSGAAESFGSTVAYAPAGSIALTSVNGGVAVDAPATLNVSALGASAGSVSVQANGSNGAVALNGSLIGNAGTVAGQATPTQGSFSLDVAQLSSGGQFDQINNLLNAGGFTGTRTIRVQNGNITQAAGATLTANNVTVEADNGNVTLGGTINAGGAEGGNIQIYAQQASAGSGYGNVTLQAGAALNAAATAPSSGTGGSTGNGGNVLIATGSADGQMQATVGGGSDINFASGATINVSGMSGGNNGTVDFRAPRVGSGGGSDVAINSLAGTVVGSRSTVIEANKVYTTASISNNATVSNGDGTYSNIQVATSTGAATGVLYTDAQSFASSTNIAAIQSRLGSAATIEAGIELRSPGDLLVSVNEGSASKQNRGWNLDTWRFNAAPIVLTLRAAGNLNIDGSISDGFVKPTGAGSTASLSLPDWTLDTTASSSLRLAGGADLGAANPLAVLNNTQGGGNVNIQFAAAAIAGESATNAPVAMVRTGTGSISVAAGGDVVLGQTADPANAGQLLGAVIYTAGMQDTNSVATGLAPKDQLNTEYGAATNRTTAASFGIDGGAISVLADGSVIGVPTSQLVNNWLFHQGETSTDANGDTVFSVIKGKTANTAWWARPDYFDQGIATMAGGDVTVSAVTGNLQDVSASTATDAYMPGSAPTVLVENGGGNLNVSAGGNILGGSFFVQRGTASLFAGGSIMGGNQATTNPADANLNTLLALGDAQMNVAARDNLTIETIYNPTMALQSLVNSGVNINQLNLTNLEKLPQFSNFSTYSNDSAVTLTSVAGDITMSHNTQSLIDLNTSVVDFNLGGDSYSALYNFQAPNLTVAALSGSVAATNGFTLAGAPAGQLNILAANSILIPNTPIVMQDIPLANFSPYNAPRYLNLDETADGGVLDGSTSAPDSSAHVLGGLHTGDSQPVRIVALNGDIIGSDTALETVVLPKPAQISAGHNIQDLSFTIQNNAVSDVTTISAGNDFIDSTVVPSRSAPGLNQVTQYVDGPGRVDISAGNTVDLGDGSGIITRGNLNNPYLPSGGAAINIQAGGGSANYVAFADNYVTPTSLSTADQAALLAYVGSLNPGAAGSLDTAWTAFKGMSAATQATFLDTIKPDLNALFFTQLVSASTIKGLSLFDSTIASLYSTNSSHSGGGDINVFGSELETQQGGSIYMFAPFGSVYAGLNTVPSYLSTDKTAAQLGIFTVGGGAIGALVHDNFEVDQGRVFTLAGGNITLVSQYGDLSAGEGTKTASSAPPPTLVQLPDGVTYFDISDSISGSGIATLKTSPDVPDANIYVIAPRGVFDAGDAGVRSSGSVDVNALVVLNAGNIVAAGTISGVPAIESSNIAAAVPTNATPSSADIAKNIANAAATSDSTTTTLSVDVLGYGSDCKDKDGCGDDKSKGGKGQAGNP